MLGTPHIVFTELTNLWLKEQRFVGCFGRQIETHGDKLQHTYKLAVDLVQQGKLKLEAFRPVLYPVARWREALAAAVGVAREKPIKVALDFRNM